MSARSQVQLGRIGRILPGGATRTILVRGPFRFSRNPLYVGLIGLDVGLARL